MRLNDEDGALVTAAVAPDLFCSYTDDHRCCGLTMSGRYEESLVCVRVASARPGAAARPNFPLVISLIFSVFTPSF